MRKGRWLVALGLIAAVAAGPAAAQERGIYLGGSLGTAQYKELCDDVTLGSCKEDDTGWRAFAGYQLNRNFALELGYANLGEVGASGLFLGLPTSFVTEVKGFDLSAILSFPLMERLSLLARLGAYRLRTTADVDVAGAVSGAGESNSGLTYGLGLGTDIGKLGIRAEWQRYENAGGGATGEDTIDFFSLGALFRF
jgi:OOP family OmpA-OmpF porin